jgi:predicted nuclease of predicted toxin-antitoxin system
VKFLLDMNLSPAWVPVLRSAGWETSHWSAVGEAAATDAHIMAWAQANDCCVITNDLDFSAILAATRAQGPSIVQIRGQDLAPTVLADTLVGVLRGHADAMAHGVIVTLDLRTARVRTLPLP